MDVKKNILTGVQQGVGFLLALAIGGFFILAINSYCPTLHYKSGYVPRNEKFVELTVRQQKTLNELVSKGQVMSLSDFHSDTLSFYSTLITWLIGLLGATAILGYIYIQGLSQEKAEQQAEKAVENHLGKDDTQKKLREWFRAAAEAQFTQLDDLQARLDALEEKIEYLPIPLVLPNVATGIAPVITATVPPPTLIQADNKLSAADAPLPAGGAPQIPVPEPSTPPKQQQPPSTPKTSKDSK